MTQALKVIKTEHDAGKPIINPGGFAYCSDPVNNWICIFNMYTCNNDSERIAFMSILSRNLN